MVWRGRHRPGPAAGPSPSARRRATRWPRPASGRRPWTRTGRSTAGGNPDGGASSAHAGGARSFWLGDCLRGQPMLDLMEALPQGLVEVADAELDPQRPGALLGVVEVLVHGHLGWHVHGVPGDPVVAFAVDLRVAAALEDVQHGLGVGVGVAPGLGRLLEDVGYGYGLGLEAIGLVAEALAAAHEDVDGAMAVGLMPGAVLAMSVAVAVIVAMVAVAVAVGCARSCRRPLSLSTGVLVDPVLRMERDAPAIVGELGGLLAEAGLHVSGVLALLLQLDQAAQVDE